MIAVCSHVLFFLPFYFDYDRHRISVGSPLGDFCCHLLTVLATVEYRFVSGRLCFVEDLYDVLYRDTITRTWFWFSLIRKMLPKMEKLKLLVT